VKPFRSQLASLTMAACLTLLVFLISLAIGVSGSVWNGKLTEMMPVIEVFRLPRTSVALMCGGLFGCAGSLTQNLFRNPLASPSVLGIESTGSLFVTLATVFGITTIATPGITTLAAIAGCIAAMLFVLTFVPPRGSMQRGTTRLVLGGLALTTAGGSITSLMLSFALIQPGKTSTVLNWLLGSLAGRNWQDVLHSLPFAAAGLILAWYTCPALDVLSLGTNVARTSGVDDRTWTRVSVMAVSFLVAAAITAGGVLPFTGLVAPHVARNFTSNSRTHAFGSFCAGAILVMLSDLIARNAAGAQELQTGVITGVIGGPFFLWALWRSPIEYREKTDAS
jgi:iron complex transport system permease protein